MTTVPDVPRIRRPPQPFRQFIVKLHSRCNLACDYCYVYRKADQRWRARPRTMSEAHRARTAARIAEHVQTHALDEVSVIIHGGEPLLAGIPGISHLVTSIRDAVPADARFSLQTNGTLLNETTLRTLLELDIRTGVSLDGGSEAHNRHRRNPDGTGSYARTSEALHQLARPAFRSVYGGVLCTIDLANDPVGSYESLLAFSPPRIDFLLPHGNWQTPPPMLASRNGTTPYADWLVAVFDRWYGAPRRETGVRLFEEIMNVLLGGHSAMEGVGLTPTSMVVVETDGAIERSDILASTFEGAAVTGCHVDRNSFDEVLRTASFLGSQAGLTDLSGGCRACDLHRVCGGGLPAHRYSPATGFANPSVYCDDLFTLISHIRDRMTEDLRTLRANS